MRDNTTKKQQLAIKVEIPSAAKRHLFPIKKQLSDPMAFDPIHVFFSEVGKL